MLAEDLPSPVHLYVIEKYLFSVMHKETLETFIQRKKCRSENGAIIDSDFIRFYYYFVSSVQVEIDEDLSDSDGEFRRLNFVKQI